MLIILSEGFEFLFNFLINEKELNFPLRVKTPHFVLRDLIFFDLWEFMSCLISHLMKRILLII